MPDFTTMRSSSWLLLCPPPCARSSDVIAIVSLRKSNVASMIGCRPSTVKLRTRARTAQAHRLSSPHPAELRDLPVVPCERHQDCVRRASMRGLYSVREGDGGIKAMHDPRDVLAGARRELARFPTVLQGLLTDLEPSAWRARPASAEWAPLEIVCHLRDEEVEDCGARTRVVVEGGAGFTPIDPERWAVERRYLEDDGPRAL